MKTQAIVLITYGILLFVGGLIGHLKSQSSASLIVGIVSALLVIIAGIGILKEYFAAFPFSCAVVGALTIFFAYRFWLTEKMMPGGIFTIISLGVFLFLLLGNRK